MPTNTNRTTILETIKQVPQKIVSYISGAVVRIFSPRDDNYPETGVQPFEGEPSHNRN
ncbi:menaquinone-specific isochorismate synthase [Rivularia sp. IAM M-261]|nr:menaquinone-specific isochorismate synthase [Rivularia sp. IAM M-261]